MFLRQSLLIAYKDLRIFAADRVALVFAIIFPLVVTFGFSSAFGSMMGTSDDLITVTMATWEGPDGISRAVIDRIDNSGAFRLQRASPEDALAAVQDGRLNGFLAFPADFTAQVVAGEQARIEVHLGPESSMERGILDSIARQIADQFGAHTVVRRSAMDLALRFGGLEAVGRLAALLTGQGLMPPGGGAGDGARPWPASGENTTVPANIIETQVGPLVDRKPASWILPGYVTMFVFFALALSAEALVGERENSTLERLVAARATKGSILFGKYLGNVAKGAVQAAILWTAGILFMDVDPGYTPWATFLVTFVLVLAAAGLGLALATVAKTRNAAGAIAVFASLTMAPLGGCWWPLLMMPSWMQSVAKITPHAWANSAFTKLLFMAAPPAAVALEIAALFGFAVLFGMLAVAWFRVEA